MFFLSIIIPVYKVEPYLRECLDSLAASLLDCWEAILIDDGSPDGCPQICDEYTAKDKRFRVIHQENTGVAAARNAGLDAAQGEWIWFVDSDDVVDMRPVGEMVNWLKEHPETDLVMFDLETFKDGDNISLHNETFSVVDEHLTKNDFLMKHICYHHPRLWYRRRCLDHHQRALRFTCGIRLAEDLELQYKYLTICKHPVIFDATLYYYRLRNNSATGNTAYRARAVEDLPIVLKNLAFWTKENDIKPEPWYDYRIMKLLQNLLYSAEKVYEMERNSCDTYSYVNDKKNGVKVNVIVQEIVRVIVKDYRDLGFSFVNNMKIRIAEWNVKTYFQFNKAYLQLKGVK